jgi:hypothetical protein
MTTSLIKSARIVAIVALACVSTYSECANHGGGGGGGGGGLSGLPTKGTCGFLLTMSYPFAYLHGNNPGPGWGVDALGTIDFQTSTIAINITLEDPAPLPSKQYPLTFTTTFTTSAGPIPNSPTITFNIPNDPSVYTINLIAVNGGKTILMQLFSPTPGSQDGSVTGTCEM